MHWKFYFKLYCFLDTENVPKDSVEFAFMFEQVKNKDSVLMHFKEEGEEGSRQQRECYYFASVQLNALLLKHQEQRKQFSSQNRPILT